MATFRNIHVSFWTDPKVEEMTVNERYLMFYLLTNPLTNLSGCYEISRSRIVRESGLSDDELNSAFGSLERNGIVKRNESTNEVLLLNWHKYNWSDSTKLDKALAKSISTIKDDDFREFLTTLYNQRETVVSNGITL